MTGDHLMLAARLPLLREELARVELSRIVIDRRAARLAGRMHAEFDGALIDCRAELDALEADLTGALAPSEGWSRYRAIRAHTASLFGESLAFMHNALAREAGVDGGMGHLADAFLDDLAGRCGIQWGRMTAMAENDHLSRFAQTIRLRFPSLTVWDLPVAAHEFGHFATPLLGATVDGMLADAMRKGRERARADLDELVADAFATFTCGPAYACTCLLLRFDAGDVHARPWLHPPAAERSYLQLAMLREMDAERPLTPAFTGVANSVSQIWHRALGLSGQTAPLDPSREEALDELAITLCEQFRARLSEAGEVTTLEGADRLAGRLAAGSSELDANDAAIDIVNAAWLARLRAWDSARDPSSVIAAAAVEALKLIASKARTNGGEAFHPAA